MFGEIDSSNLEDVKKPVKNKHHKVSSKGKSKSKKKGKKGIKKHSNKKKISGKG